MSPLCAVQTLVVSQGQHRGTNWFIPIRRNAVTTCQGTITSSAASEFSHFPLLFLALLTTMIFLRAICRPTRNCSNQNQTIERSRFECCPGFSTRPAQDRSHYEYMFRLYYSSIPVLPTGCPRGKHPDLFHVRKALGAKHQCLAAPKSYVKNGPL